MVAANADQRNFWIDLGKIVLELLNLRLVAGVSWRCVGKITTDDHESRVEAVDVPYGPLDQSNLLFESLIACEHAILRVGQLHEEEWAVPHFFMLCIESVKGSIACLSEPRWIALGHRI